MEEIWKLFCTNVHNRLKSSINASIRCNIDDEKDIMYVSIMRLGVNYDMSIKDISKEIGDGDDGIERCVTKVVKSFRNFVNHKFFY